MKILITGGLGFLGSNLSNKILKFSKYNLEIIDNFHRVGSELNLKWIKKNRPFKFNNIDVTDYKKINKKIKNFRPDIIFHFAGQVTMTKSLEDPIKDFDINVRGTLNILESIRLNSLKTKLVFSSTNKVYGDLDQFDYIEKLTRYDCKQFKHGFNESINLSFHSPYGCSKGSAEQYILDYNRIYGIKACVFRHSSMYGQRQFPTFDQGWIGWFCLQSLFIKENKIKKINILGNGKQVRDLLYVDDMIELYFCTIKNFSRINGNAYNIGGGYKNSLSIIELLEYLEKTLEIKININHKKGRVSDQKTFIADLSKIKKDLNWSPKTSYKKGIKEYLKWISSIK